MLIGVGTAIGMPAMANAVMSAVPPEKAGVRRRHQRDAGRVRPRTRRRRARRRAERAVRRGGFGRGGFAAGGAGRSRVGPRTRREITDAFASGLENNQLVGAAAVLFGGLVAATLLHRAERADSA
ncbi:MFS transporter OS=Streptomyces alboniger OX=132473 GN=CP975_17075 PE=4 SV=1 [Streptomyces alboniger]